MADVEMPDVEMPAVHGEDFLQYPEGTWQEQAFKRTITYVGNGISAAPYSDCALA
jgi:hypothetical protein